MSKCKSSRDCTNINKPVCDVKEKTCRENKRTVPDYVYRNECIAKNIPLTVERGPNKGQPKTREQLKRCKYQKERHDANDDGSFNFYVKPPTPAKK